jgi:hypothetical protein|tara:strand:- start:6605 stop:6820 length:216 start_codon:yes stop_codon:yes gene_type:complete
MSKAEDTSMEEVIAQERIMQEERKTKALEKIAMSLDALTVWFEEIDKDEWNDRLQFYMAEWHKNLTADKDE